MSLVIGIKEMYRNHPMPNLSNFQLVSWNDKDKLQQRKNTFKSAVDATEARRKREENNIKIRKSKKEERLQKRRMRNAERIFFCRTLTFCIKSLQLTVQHIHRDPMPRHLRRISLRCPMRRRRVRRVRSM